MRPVSATASAPANTSPAGAGLPDDRVTGIALEGTAAWIETPGGVSKIDYVPMTLAEKSAVFVKRVQDRHLRWGLTADSQLDVPGDLSTNRTRSTDNDGLWTAMYVAAEAFRFKVTGAADARANATRGMQAIVRLEEITGIPGFPARSFIKPGVDAQPADGEWHDTPDKQWRWKGDTSSDEIVGHYFVYPIYYDLVATDGEKPALRGVIDRITNHILDHGYQLADVDGQRTRWGWWSPDLIWDDPDELGLRALHILSHLRVALYMTENPQYRQKYQAAYDELITRHRYHLLTRNQKIMVPGHINHSDDELAFLSLLPAAAIRARCGAPGDLQGQPRAQLADRTPGAQSALERHLRGRHGSRRVRSAGNPAHAPGDPDGHGGVERDQLPAVRCADRSVERPVQAAPGAGRPARTTSCRCRSGTGIRTPSMAATADAARTTGLFPAAVLDGAVSWAH